MSTNYYATKIATKHNYISLVNIIKNKPITEALEYIEDNEKEIHIGQFASGWKFLFRWNSKYYTNYNKLIEFLENCDIRNEYWETISLKDFIEMVQKAQDKKSRFLDHKSEYDKTINGYEFMDTDFC
jgi:hypothetical protein